MPSRGLGWWQKGCRGALMALDRLGSPALVAGGQSLLEEVIPRPLLDTTNHSHLTPLLGPQTLVALGLPLPSPVPPVTSPHRLRCP